VQTIAAWASNISPGPAADASQSVSFTVVAANPALFSQQPTLTPSGVLSFAVGPNLNGSTSVSVTLRDNGGTANNGVDTSAVQTFLITATAVNDPPSLNPLGDITIAEGSAAQSVPLLGISNGAANESETVTITAVSDNPSVVPNPEVTYASPATNGSMSIKPTDHRSGTAVITVTVNDGQAASSTIQRTFTVNVIAVNDAPSFTKGADVTVLEDAGPQSLPGWASAIVAGPEDEATQALNFLVSTEDAALFTTAPAISATGVLTFTTAPDANGTATVKVRLHDDGGTEVNGVDTSAEQSFSIVIQPVNDAPSFTRASTADLTVKQNAGPQTVAGWVSAGTAGPQDEAAQSVDYRVSVDPPALFVVPPAIDATGTLTFTPSAVASGTATVSVRAHDSGGAENGGVDVGEVVRFKITTSPVNDAPSFVAGSSLSVAQDAGPQTVPGWATQIVAGPDDEQTQTVDFVVSVDAPGLFQTQPAISPDGTLSFTPLPAASGTATVTVQLHDSGGTGDGGADLSAPQTFTIAVTTFVEEGGIYNGLVQAEAGGEMSVVRCGLVRIAVTKKGRFTGKLEIGAENFQLRGTVDKAGGLHFGKGGTARMALQNRNLPYLTMELKLDVGGGTDKLKGVIFDGADTPYATVEADRALYTGSRKPVAPMRNVPPELVSAYTAVFTPKPDDTQRNSASSYP